ncbi:MAG: hypothetical protein M3162_09550 [Thermoproteota archaeon]|nr:hypothetical protein [Thermoproteota archaeon]
MTENTRNKNNDQDVDAEIERQKMIDEGGKETYQSSKKKRDDNILIDTEH